MKSSIQKIKLTAKWLLFFLLLAFALSVFIEFISRGSMKETWQWGRENPPAFVANYLIVLGCLLFSTAIISRARLSFWFTTIVLLVPAVVSGIKLKTQGSPLFPWDIMLGYRQFQLGPDPSSFITSSLVIGVGIFLLFSVGFLYLKGWFNLRLAWISRLIAAVSALAILSIPYADKLYPLKKEYSLAAIPYNQEQGYHKNGFLLSTLMNLDVVHVDKPNGYDKNRIETILNHVEATEPDTFSKVHPNIIVVLSEAFWDPTIMGGIKFSTDPIPTFHQLGQKFPSGWMLSPQFGGGTANVEFEVLTGHSMRFLPDSSIPYVNYIHQGVDSMASILTRDGYKATAINPFYSWFFNSKNVYKDFGFSKFVSSEFFPQNIEGMFLSDHEVANQIIEATNQTSGPDFVFANTMENHYPFYPGKFKENTIKVEGDISEASKGELETYAQGISSADKMLAQLVDYYSNHKEPTVVVFFGDHMPALADSVYTETHYFQENDPNLLEKKYREPVLVWNNYLPEHKDDLYISPSFLSPYVLHLAGQQGSNYTNYLYSLSKRIPVIPPADSYEKMHIQASELEDYKLLEYDSLFGDQYSYNKLKKPIIDSGFALGQGNIVVNQAVEDQKSDSLEEVTISGENFPPDSILYVNGTPTETKVENGGLLSASIPVGGIEDQGKVKLQVKVKDSRNIVVAASNTVQVEVHKK